MNNLEKLMLLSCRPTTEEAIKSFRRDNGEDSPPPSNTADDLMLYNRMMQASIDRRKLNPETQADCSHSDKLQGLRPYHCTYPSCPTGGKLYHSRSDWMEHEKVAHHQLWRCRDHHNFSCHSRDAFERHLMEEHRSLKVIHRKAWMDIYKPATKDLRRHCPICLAGTELIDQTLAEHIAEHLEQLAVHASSYTASDTARQVLQLFNKKQSRPAPRVHDRSAPAPTADLTWDTVVGHTVATTARDRIHSRSKIPDIDDGPTRRTKRSTVDARKVDINWEAIGNRGYIDLPSQQMPPVRHDPPITDHQPDVYPEAHRDFRLTPPSWDPHNHVFNGPSRPERPPPPRTPSLRRSGSHSSHANSMATSTAPTYFRPFSHDPQNFVDGGLGAGRPSSFSDTERDESMSSLYFSSLVASVGTGRLSSSRRQRESDLRNNGNPYKTREPPSARRSSVTSRRDVQQERGSPTPLWRCNMPLCGRTFSWKAELSHHEWTHRPYQTPLNWPESARNGGPLTPLRYTGSPPGPFGHDGLHGNRERVIGTSQGNRDEGRISIAGTAQGLDFSLGRQIVLAKTQVCFQPPSGTQRSHPLWKDHTPVSHNTASSSHIARPRSPDGALAGGRLAGENHRGVEINSASDMSSLFPSFKQQPRRFFRMGRVFLVLWSEHAGGSSPVTSRAQGSNVNGYGERVHSKVRRFVVIRESNTHCHALPLSTYGGEGVAGHGVRNSEHMIVYTGHTAPSARWDEHPRPGESGMRPMAVRVDPDSPAEHLHEMSRLDLGDITRIEHDVMVEDYGQVSKQSMPDLLEAFMMVWSLDDPIDSVEDDDEDWVLLGDTGDEDDGGYGDASKGGIGEDKDEDDGEEDEDEDEDDDEERSPGK